MKQSIKNWIIQYGYFTLLMVLGTISLVVFSSCASGPTDYHQGCTDALVNIESWPSPTSQSTCNLLEYEYNKKLRYDYLKRKDRP